MNMYDLFRGLHIIAVIAWMAGLLYLPRLFIYHIKNAQNPDIVAVFTLMQRNLLRIIMNPAMIIAWVFGSILIYLNIHDRWGWEFLWKPWFLVKEIGIIAITIWHHYLAISFKKLQRAEPIGSESYWRKVNEVPFVLAIIMVLAVTSEFVLR